MDDTVNNLLTAIQPNGIERQEAREQALMVANIRLPKEYSGDYKDSLTTRSIFETLGIKVLGGADDLFWNVELPEGWKLVPTDHSMWSKLVDPEGRERISVFYKGAFYDRRAYISLINRYAIVDRTYEDPPVAEMQLTDLMDDSIIATLNAKNVRAQGKFDVKAHTYNEKQRAKLAKLIPKHNSITWELE